MPEPKPPRCPSVRLIQMDPDNLEDEPLEVHCARITREPHTFHRNGEFTWSGGSSDWSTN